MSIVKQKRRYVFRWAGRMLLYIFLSWYLAAYEIWEEYKTDKTSQALVDRLEKKEVAKEKGYIGDKFPEHMEKLSGNLGKTGHAGKAREF